MSLPVLGAAIQYAHLDLIETWLRDKDRAIEIQDFVMPDVLAGDPGPVIEAYRTRLAGYGGQIGIHGPFYGLDIANPDREFRALVTKRLLTGLGIAERLGGTHMVIHSPFTYWHQLNYATFDGMRDDLFSMSAECLADVLSRAEDVGVTLMLENIDDASPHDRVELVRFIHHPNLKVSVDTGHADLAHGSYRAPPVVDYIHAAGTLLGHVHLQDADGHADRHWHPGEGRIAWRPVFDSIARGGGNPRLILEVARHIERLPQTAAALEARHIAC